MFFISEISDDVISVRDSESGCDMKFTYDELTNNSTLKVLGLDRKSGKVSVVTGKNIVAICKRYNTRFKLLGIPCDIRVSELGYSPSESVDDLVTNLFSLVLMVQSNCINKCIRVPSFVDKIEVYDAWNSSGVSYNSTGYLKFILEERNLLCSNFYTEELIESGSKLTTVGMICRGDLFKIDKDAFSFTEMLNEFYLEGDCHSINSEAFNNCVDLKTIHFNNIGTIKECAFALNTGLSLLEFGAIKEFSLFALDSNIINTLVFKGGIDEFNMIASSETDVKSALPLALRGIENIHCTEEVFRLLREKGYLLRNDISVNIIR